jgi:hypothetical protein
MADTEILAPDKNLPHAFEAGPEVPIVYPSSGASLQETSSTDGEAPQHTSGANCALCRAPRGAQIHLDGKAALDDESPNWGL